MSQIGKMGRNWLSRPGKGKPKHPESLINTGADERSRTSDLLITNQLLYQLSYISATAILAKKPVCADDSMHV